MPKISERVRGWIGRGSQDDRAARTSALPPCGEILVSAPTMGSASAAETLPHIESDLEKTATAMRKIVKCAILDLSTFPHGIHFSNVVYYDTGKTFPFGGDRRTGEEPRRGKIYAVVIGKGAKESNGEDRGEIQIRKASGVPNEYGELDLNSAESHRATDQEVIDYTEAIMITIKRRLEETRTKAIVDYRPKDTQRNSEDTNCLTTDLINVDEAISQLQLEKVAFTVRHQQSAA